MYKWAFTFIRLAFIHYHLFILSYLFAASIQPWIASTEGFS